MTGPGGWKGQSRPPPPQQVEQIGRRVLPPPHAAQCGGSSPAAGGGEGLPPAASDAGPTKGKHWREGDYSVPLPKAQPPLQLSGLLPGGGKVQGGASLASVAAGPLGETGGGGGTRTPPPPPQGRE